MAISPANKERAGKAGIFVLGALATALIGGPVGYHYATRANTALVIQQQKLTEVQHFETTGAALDNAVRQFSDAMADRNSTRLEEARQSLRGAIAGHSSQVFAMRGTMGEADYRPYMATLGVLRQRTDAANPQQGVQMWQAAVDLIGHRRRIADRIKAEVEAS